MFSNYTSARIALLPFEDMNATATDCFAQSSSSPLSPTFYEMPIFQKARKQKSWQNITVVSFQPSQIISPPVSITRHGENRCLSTDIEAGSLQCRMEQLSKLSNVKRKNNSVSQQFSICDVSNKPNFRLPPVSELLHQVKEDEYTHEEKGNAKVALHDSKKHFLPLPSVPDILRQNDEHNRNHNKNGNQMSREQPRDISMRLNKGNIIKDAPDPSSKTACESSLNSLANQSAQLITNTTIYECHNAFHLQSQNQTEGGNILMIPNSEGAPTRARFACGTCHLEFKRKYDAVQHITAIHEGLKKFSCAVCGRAFSRKFSCTVRCFRSFSS